MLMSNEFEPDLISLIDDDGTEYQFEILDVIEHDGRTFFALCPNFDDPEEALNDDGEYMIMEQILEDEEPMLAEVEDDSLLDYLASVFEEHFEELFDEEMDEEQDADE